MERIPNINDAYRIMGQNIIGCNEILTNKTLKSFIQIKSKSLNFPIPYSIETLEKFKDTHFLILIIPDYIDGSPLKFIHFRNLYGIDPSISEPCFYNQDWYLNEKFYLNTNLELSWKLISKDLNDVTKSLLPNEQSMKDNNVLPALFYTYIFFIYYSIKKLPLWEFDYIWTSDFDSNNDQIYVGRYYDISKYNKNGFSIHRHLKIKNNYGLLNCIQ